jgi:hypothetical protein
MARLLLFPLVILCGITGGLLLIGSILLTEIPAFVIIPYCVVLTAVIIYLKTQTKFLVALRHYVLSVVTVFVLMSMLFFSFCSIMDIKIFTLLSPWKFLSGIVVIILCAAIVGYLSSLVIRKPNLTVGK